MSNNLFLRHAKSGALLTFTLATMNIRAAITLLVFFLFAGECLAGSSLTLTGRYEYRTDSESLEMLGSLVCFHPSSNSAKLLPRPKSDKRLAWFCFKNEAQSKELLGIPAQKNAADCGVTGEATIRVNEYAAYIDEGDGFDTALLQSVSSRAQPKALPCR